MRLRAAGMSLQAAIGQATSAAGQPEPSFFAGLCRRHPGLIPRVLRKAALLALTRAIEYECCARAERPVLFAGFGESAVASRPSPGPAPTRVALPADAPARREWTLVCDSRDYPACVTGWEFPGLGLLLDALPSEPPAPPPPTCAGRPGLLTRMTSYLEKPSP